MKRMLVLVVAVAAIAALGDSSAQAQTYAGGYQFGAGLQSYCGGSFRGYVPREQPPYFAQYPPVYYSHIVARPYGVSPYAAPAGIAPVEMSVAPAVPLSVRNPFFPSEVERVSGAVDSSDEATEIIDNKTTSIAPVWISNPFSNTATSVAGVVR